jgi:ABC-type microcin C transport system permease subunit YejB
MLVFAARRILQAIPILFGVSLVVFGLVHIVPGNPIDLLMPPEASPAVIAQMKAAFGFDKPLYVQYLLWLSRALRGDFGLSVFNATPVWGQLIAALPRGSTRPGLRDVPRTLARQAVLRYRHHRRQPAALLVRHRAGSGLCGAARLAARAGHG